MNLLFGITERSFTYLDPGSGSILIQVLLAALLGIGIVTKTYWQKIKAFFTRQPSDSNSDDKQSDN